MKPYKIKWQVSPVPTGRYSSFDRRGWPTACYDDVEFGDVCAFIQCDDEYRPTNVKTGNHAELTLIIADYSKEGNSWGRVKSTKKYATLKEAKEALVRILKANEYLVPSKYHDD